MGHSVFPKTSLFSLCRVTDSLPPEPLELLICSSLQFCPFKDAREVEPNNLYSFETGFFHSASCLQDCLRCYKHQ